MEKNKLESFLKCGASEKCLGYLGNNIRITNEAVLITVKSVCCYGKIYDLEEILRHESLLKTIRIHWKRKAKDVKQILKDVN